MKYRENYTQASVKVIGYLLLIHAYRFINGYFFVKC